MTTSDATALAPAGPRPTRPRRRWAAVPALALLLAACGDDGGADASGAGGDDPGSDAAAEVAAWPTMGYDLANTRAVADDGELGPDTVADLTPTWELDGILGFSSTPLVEDGAVYGGDWAGDLHALDAATGEPHWSTPLGDSGRIQASPALDDERVYAANFAAELYAVDRETGEIAWETLLDDHEFASAFAAPVHVDGLVIVGVASFENMIVSGEEATFRGSVVAYDAETGEEEWRYWTTAGDEEEGAGVGVWTTPAVDTERGLLYIGTGQHYNQPTHDRSDAVIALNIATGEEEWVHQFTGGDTWTAADGGLDADVSASPTLFESDGQAVVGSGDKAGSYRAIDRDTGEEVWSVDLTDGSAQGGVMSGAAVVDGTLYVLSNQEGQVGELFALDTTDGETIWSHELEAAAMGPVTWANGVLFVADNSAALYALDAEDGTELWSHTVGSQSATGFAVVEDTVYAGYGWWLAGPPDEPQGGLLAFGLGDEAGAAAGDADDGGEGAAGDDGEGDDGAELFGQSCASCHGADGSGANGPSLIEVGDRLDTGEIRTVIEEGRGGMPGWGDRLDDDEIDALVDYLEDL